ncbi:MAG: nitroreductase/quinone reductase family protein [Gammaproteobacteria bacterium]|nr:nitroreductase/quinone reductase family protein [Gammaproteobacteria bacterium]MDE0271911.1 nitroreductase/quinone reductase family protein [Gammaproteobacteria bacterium]
MKRAVLIVVAVLPAVYLAALLVPYEPDERRPGMRLGGPLAAEQDTDWSFRSPGRMQIFVETATWYGVPHSVTTTSWIVDGDLYVPCNACATKRWPKNVARNPDVRLKVGVDIYERRAVRVEDDAERRRLFAALTARPVPPGRWVFRMEAR